MIEIKCDRCKKRIANEQLNNRVQLVKWRDHPTDRTREVKKALTETFDLCDTCEEALGDEVIDLVRNGPLDKPHYPEATKPRGAE